MSGKVKDLEFVLDWKGLVMVVVAGVCITFLLGLVENPPEIWLRHITRYGYPLVWRIVGDFSPVEYNIIYLLADFVFWIAIMFTLAAISDGIARKFR